MLKICIALFISVILINSNKCNFRNSTESERQFGSADPFGDEKEDSVFIKQAADIFFTVSRQKLTGEKRQAHLPAMRVA